MIPDFDRDEELTMGEIFSPAIDIAERGDKKEAEQFIDAYVRYILKRNNWSPEEALRVVLSNIGYASGYYGTEAMEAVKEVFGAHHPVFG